MSEEYEEYEVVVDTPEIPETPPEETPEETPETPKTPEEIEREKRVKACYTSRERKSRRLEIYYDELEDLLSTEKSITAGVQSYTINGKSVTRYQTSLSEVRKRIDELLDKIEALECALQGCSRKKVVGVIPIDI